jgi:MATE family multidrug resistance protein
MDIAKSMPLAGKGEYKNLLRLGAPVLVTQAGVIVVSFADTMMVGAYGTNQLAASAFVNNFFLVVVLMLIGFAGGITPLVGALYSQKRYFEAGRTFRGGLQLNMMMALLVIAIMGVLYLFLDKMGQSPEIIPIARPYYLMVLVSIIPMSFFNASQQMSNGVGDTSVPMWIILGSNALNVLGNYALIFGKLGCPELGLTGAGISTVTARWCSAIAIALVHMRCRRYQPYLKGLFTSGSMSTIHHKVWRTSYPLMIQSGMESVLWTLGAMVCGWFGKIQLSAYQIVTTIGQLGFMTYLSFGVATSIRVAHATGVGDVAGIRRAANAGLHLVLLLATIASAVFFIFGNFMLHSFTSDELVIHSAKMLILPLILYQYADGVQLTYSSALRGTSKVKPLLWIATISYVIVGIPVMLLLSVTAGFGHVGVYYSFCISLFLTTIMVCITFKKAVREKEITLARK